MKTVKQLLLVALVCTIAIGSVAEAKPGNGRGKKRNPKNVIVLVPDGCDSSIQTAARWYKEHAMGDPAPLALDEIGNTGMVKTYMANSVITGSAAAGTAFATGEKTTVRFLGVGPDPALHANLPGFVSDIAPYAPIESVLEAAQKAGKATGLVATSRITHATPAAYACHIKDRGMDNEIMEHMVYNGVDVVFGGGARHLIPSGSSYVPSFSTVENPVSWGGKRADGENLIDVLFARGYQFVDSKDTLDAVTSAPVWGLFAASHMDPDLDRDDLNPTQPSIAEMTAKAIELLSADEDGFFIMIEGSQIDWAGHANDPVYMITEHLAFDAAVQVALDYAKTNDDTMVIVFPDHNTGAMSIGQEQGPGAPGYTSTSVEAVIDPIKDATITLQQLMYEIAAPATPATVRDAFVTYWGTWWADPVNMSDAQAQVIADHVNTLGAYDGYYPTAQYVSSEFTVFGWTTHGHSGEDVPLWCYTGRADERAVGTFDNTELAHVCADYLDVELRGTNAWMTMPVNGTTVALDTSDAANPVIVLTQGSMVARFPVFKDIVEINGSVIDLMYVTVYDDVNNVAYIPLQ